MLEFLPTVRILASVTFSTLNTLLYAWSYVNNSTYCVQWLHIYHGYKYTSSTAALLATYTHMCPKALGHSVIDYAIKIHC